MFTFCDTWACSSVKDKNNWSTGPIPEKSGCGCTCNMSSDGVLVPTTSGGTEAISGMILSVALPCIGQEAGLLLPPILDGCVSLCNNTRGICIELLGDILYKLAGSIEVVEKAEAHLAQALMPDTRREVLSVLYFTRCDASCSNVRNQALTVWKNVVSNTPKTLRFIMPELTSQITKGLASDD